MASLPATFTSVRVESCSDASQMPLVRELFTQYAASLPFSLCFQGFEQELATLPGRYAPPMGRILLAWGTPGAGASESIPIGCVALRAIESLPEDPAPVCEMKRMYVPPAYRGLGVGRLLAERLLGDARAIGYRMMKLDSEPDFQAAVSLYRSLGFTPTPRYNDDPHPQTIYLGLRL